jgi:hypothetical protein
MRQSGVGCQFFTYWFIPLLFQRRAKERPVNNGLAGCPVRPSRAVEINSRMICAFYVEGFIQCQLAAFPVNIHNQHLVRG